MYVNKLANNYESAYKLVTNNRQFTMDKAKLRHDRQIAGRNFQKGDKVWLLIKARKKGITSSIAHRYDGAYTVLESMNSVRNFTNKILLIKTCIFKLKSVNNTFKLSILRIFLEFF